MQQSGKRKNWSEEETILAFFYYCQIPFGKIGQGNHEIIRIANLIGRTPGSVALKMANLASYDPKQRERGVVGMEHGSHLDGIVVNKFYNDWESLAETAFLIEEKFKNQQTVDVIEQVQNGNGLEAVQKKLISKKFFRESVFSAYENRCCVSGIEVPELLVATYIKPWDNSDPKIERGNPCNGLCLSTFHGRAFEKGLITVSPDYKIHVSSKIKQIYGNEGINWLKKSDSMQIILPNKFLPDKELLEYHNDVIFIP